MKTEIRFLGRAIRLTKAVSALVVGLCMAGCWGSETHFKAGMAVSLSTSTSPTLDQGMTITITATVTNDSQHQGVTWSVSPATGHGWLSNATPTSVTFNVPASVTANVSAAVTATAVADPTQSASISIQMMTPPVITDFDTPAGTVGTPYTGTVWGSGGVTPYTWSVASGALPDGLSLASSTSGTVTISGTPTKAGTFPFIVKITDADGDSATRTLRITISPAVAPLTITTTSPLPAGTAGTAYSQTLTATGGVTPYTWSLASGSSLPTGLNLSSSGNISGTPTAAVTGATFTVDVADSETPTPQSTSQQFSLTINQQVIAGTCSGAPTGHESLLNGHYALLVQGFEGSVNATPVAMVGSFFPDGTGKLSKEGELDLWEAPNNRHSLGISPSSTSSSNYTVGPDPTGSGDIGCAEFALSAGPDVVFHFSLGKPVSSVYTEGYIIKFDDTTGSGMRGSGILRIQNLSSFAFQSNYAFGLDGVDHLGGHYAMAGSFTMSGANMTNVFLDVNDAGTTSGGLSGGSGYISGITQSLGIGDMYLSVGSYSPHFVFCFVNPNEIFVMGIDSSTSTPPILSGRLLATGAPNSFSQASLSGNYVWHETGSLVGVAKVILGQVNVSNPDLSITMYWCCETTGTQSIQAAYSVDSTSGRTAVDSLANSPTLHEVMYLTTPTDGISAFVVNTDVGAGFGFFEASSGAPYTTAGLAGTWLVGTEDPSDNGEPNWAGVATVKTNGNIQGTVDASDAQGLHPGTPITYTLTISDPSGRGDVGANTVAITNGRKIFFFDASAVIRVFELATGP
jgi:hypothetical protein